MKKVIVGLLAGLALGGGAAWLLLPRSGTAAPESSPKAEPAGEKAGPGLHLTDEQLAQAGLTVALPGTVTLNAEVKAYGHVLDPTPLVTLVAEIAMAQATLNASEKEFVRVKSLHEQDQNASAQAVETAEAAARRDRIALDSVQARLVVGWGRALARHTDLAGLIHTLVAGEASLARLELLPGDTPAKLPTTARVGLLTGDTALRDAEVLGLAPTTDAQTQGAGYLVLWRTDPLPPGTALRAFLPAGGEARPALVVPRSALLQHAGSMFVYVQIGKGEYARKLVEPGQSLPDGIVVTAGIGERDQVVTVGAQQLLSAELQAAGITGN